VTDDCHQRIPVRCLALDRLAPDRARRSHSDTLDARGQQGSTRDDPAVAVKDLADIATLGKLADWASSRGE
jgi:hypothetical protein